MIMTKQNRLVPRYISTETLDCWFPQWIKIERRIWHIGSKAWVWRNAHQSQMLLGISVWCSSPCMNEMLLLIFVCWLINSGPVWHNIQTFGHTIHLLQSFGVIPRSSGWLEAALGLLITHILPVLSSVGTSADTTGRWVGFCFRLQTAEEAPWESIDFLFAYELVRKYILS